MEICIALVLMLVSGLSMGFMAGLIWHDDIKDFQEWRKAKSKNSK